MQKKKLTKDLIPKGVKEVIYPEGFKDQQSWEKNLLTPTNKDLLNLMAANGDKRPKYGRLFSIHEPFPYTEETLIKDSYQKEVIKIAQKQFQDKIDNILPFQIQ